MVAPTKEGGIRYINIIKFESIDITLESRLVRYCQICLWRY